MKEFESINPEHLSLYEVVAEAVAAEAEQAAFAAMEQQRILDEENAAEAAADVVDDAYAALAAERIGFFIASLEEDMEDIVKKQEEIRGSIEATERSPVEEAEALLDEDGKHSIGSQAQRYLEAIYAENWFSKKLLGLSPQNEALAYHMQRARTIEERRQVIEQYITDPNSLTLEL